MELSENKCSPPGKPHRHHQMQHSHVNMSYNPFGDCFGPPAASINDNELFGLEFDRIRHQSVGGSGASSSNAAAAASAVTSESQTAMQDGGLPTTTSKISSEPMAVPSHEKSARSGDKKLAKGQLSSSASSNSSSTSFSQSSSLFELRKLSSGSSTSSSSTKSPSPNTLSSKTAKSTGKSKQQKTAKQGKKDQQSRLASHYVFDDDPFRSAPFKAGAVDRLSNSSSHSSTSMATITNRSATKSKTKKPKTKSKRSVESETSKTSAAPAAEPQSHHSVTPKQQFNSDASAFQPYRRPPDPFLSAPFEN